MNDKKLWQAFSIFIRLRDANEDGMCTCITCGRMNHWKKMDCGHGIGRQHWATRYNEKNNHAQCKPCNGFEGGKREVYKIEVDKRYGAGTWDKMELLSRVVTKKPSQFEIDTLRNHYLELVKKMKA